MRRRGTIAIILAATLALSACGMGGSDSGGETTANEDTVADRFGGAETEAVAEGETSAGDDAAERDAATGGESAPGEGVDAAGFGQIQASALRRVIRDATIELAVEDTQASFDAIRRLATRVGGFVASADLQRHDPSREAQLSGTIVIRVPSDGLEDVLAELEGLAAEVRSKSLSSDDVTEEYVDLEARLTNLRAMEIELQELLAEVRDAGDSSPDVLFTVFERIRQVRDEIERIEGRMRMLDDLVALSTVTVHLSPAEGSAIAATDAAPWRPAEVVREAATTLAGALQAVANVAIWLAVFVVPVLLVLALPLTAAAFGARWWRRRSQPTGS